METPEHLGGHLNITHLDPGVILWLRSLGIRSMLDIGCGPGGMVELAQVHGIESHGIDGDPTLWWTNPKKDPRFTLWDFTKGRLNPVLSWDVAWSCEFLEHVEERLIPNYMPCFQVCREVIVTFAPPGAPGHHHVNCKPEYYWLDIFAKYGFMQAEVRTKELREHSTMQRDFVRNTGLFFYNMDGV